MHQENSDMELWFNKLVNDLIEPGLVFLIGDIGVGKKTFINKIINKNSYRCININCVYDKDHSRLKKKTFVNELKHMVTNRNIEYFLTGKKDVVLIHNLHVITDKAFYDELHNLKNTTRFVTPVICILNRHFISERFLSYITKNCITFYHKPKSPQELMKILEDSAKDFGLKRVPTSFHSKIENSNGNIYSLLTQLRQYSLTKDFYVNTSYNKIDKNIVTKCFDDLCNPNNSWIKKQDYIKSQGSLVRLLMPSHIFNGLDEDSTKTTNEKLDITIKCLDKMAHGERVSGNNHTFYTSLLQCIYPTLLVKNTTIKSMILSNCYSSSNTTTLPRLLGPHPDDQYIYIIYYIIIAIELEQVRKKIEDITPWKTWLPNISKTGLNELQQKHFRIFSNYNITKKKINRFLLRVNGNETMIPDNIDQSK
tara:strand:- start:10875 stop:12143 length:1269 start_codon:yes stop_codon:yes gene_type:complete